MDSVKNIISIVILSVGFLGELQCSSSPDKREFFGALRDKKVVTTATLSRRPVKPKQIHSDPTTYSLAVKSCELDKQKRQSYFCWDALIQAIKKLSFKSGRVSFNAATEEEEIGKNEEELFPCDEYGVFVPATPERIKELAKNRKPFVLLPAITSMMVFPHDTGMNDTSLSKARFRRSMLRIREYFDRQALSSNSAIVFRADSMIKDSTSGEIVPLFPCSHELKNTNIMLSFTDGSIVNLKSLVPGVWEYKKT